MYCVKRFQCKLERCYVTEGYRLFKSGDVASREHLKLSFAIWPVSML